MGWPLTAKTQALVDNFDDSQSPLVTCGNPGPPKAMILPYPFMLTRPDDNTIVIERELMQEKRIIHLNGTGEMGAPSRLGFSSGRFEGDQLIAQDFEIAKAPEESRHLLLAGATADEDSGLPLYKFDITLAPVG